MSLSKTSSSKAPSAWRTLMMQGKNKRRPCAKTMRTDESCFDFRGALFCLSLRENIGVFACTHLAKISIGSCYWV